LFFVSGACGLIYQVTWTRIMTHVFGTTVYAVSIVLTAFMAGLAIGSYYLGKTGDRSSKPLRLYAWYELGIGVTALVSLFLMDRLVSFYLALNDTIGSQALLFNSVRFLVAALVLLLPTILMGATLPILSRFIITGMKSLGKNLGTLYAVNTFGAVVGSLAAGFFLIRNLGVHNSVYLACVLNLAVGVIAFALSMKVPAGAPAETKAGAPPANRHRLLLFAFALSGFTSFAYEVYWTRSLVFLFGNSTYAFVTMLTAFLVGIALGGYTARFFVDRLRVPIITFAWVEVLIGLFAGVAMPVLVTVVYSDFTENLFRSVADQWLVTFLLRFGFSLLVMLVPTMLIGSTFPLVGRIYIQGLDRTSADVGKIYAVNTFGNILGAFIPGLIILPLLGINKSVLLMAAINIAIGAVILLAKRTSVLGYAATALALVVAVFIAWLPVDFQFPSDTQRKGDEVLFYKEGISGTTKVYVNNETGEKSISVDGANIGGTNFYVNHKQQVLAHLPKLLIPHYESELSIGLGSGILVGECARYDALKRIVCVELAPSVKEGAAYFEKETGGVLSNPRVEIVVNDGINHLLTTAERFHIISSDAKSKPEHGGNGVFFSEEYYSLIEEHLEPGGLFIQWIPIYYPRNSYLTIIKTFTDTFPYASLWMFPAGHSFLVGTTHELKIDFARIEKMLDDPLQPLQGLKEYGISSAGALLSHCATMRPVLAEQSQGAATNSFEYPYIEFYSFKDYAVPFKQRNLGNLAFILSLRKDVYNGPPLANISDGERIALDRICSGLTSYMKGQLLISGQKPGHQRWFNQAVELSGGDELLPFYVSSHDLQKAQFFFNSRRYNKAETAAKQVLAIYPRSAKAHFILGSISASKGLLQQAEDMLEKAVELDPKHLKARRQLQEVYQKLGRPEDRMKRFR
jgi:spermidine synthase